MARNRKPQDKETPLLPVSGYKLNLHLWLLSLTSSVLLSLPFLVPGLGLISLVGFVPLLAAEYLAGEYRKKHFWVIYYSCFLLWNLASTYWIYKATPAGAAAAIILNALQMAVVFRLFRWMRSLTDGFLPYIFFIVTWLAWENAYYQWDVSWPWLVLGNAFAASVKIIQWYEFTGTLGGSLWVLLFNTLLFRIIIMALRKEKIKVSVISLALVFIIPIAVSQVIFYSYKEVPFEPSSSLAGTPQAGSRTFTLLQPNIDPYNDKFGGLTPVQQDEILTDLAENALKEKVLDDTSLIAPAHFLIGPETFISPLPYWNLMLNEKNPFGNDSFAGFFNLLKDFNRRYSLSGAGNINMILGAVTTVLYDPPYRTNAKGAVIPPTVTAQENKWAGSWYDRFNTALFLGSDGKYDFYHKSKLVVVVESTPYKKLFRFMSKASIDLGGNMGHFGTQPERTVFTTPDSVKIGTAICYEAIYGDFYREYVLKGAQVMAVISNDGWWGDTPGYRQLLNYSALRAIETRRSIARSANTGISAFINQRGEITTRSGWWKKEYLNGRLNLNDRKTVFVTYGDITGRSARFLFFLFVLMGIARTISRKYIARA